MYKVTLQVNDYLLRDRKAYSEPGQRSEMERFGKIITIFNYFFQKTQS